MDCPLHRCRLRRGLFRARQLIIVDNSSDTDNLSIPLTWEYECIVSFVPGEVNNHRPQPRTSGKRPVANRPSPDRVDGSFAGADGVRGLAGTSDRNTRYPDERVLAGSGLCGAKVAGGAGP